MNWESVSCLSQMGNGLEYILQHSVLALRPGVVCQGGPGLSYPKHQKVLLIQRKGKLSQTL